MWAGLLLDAGRSQRCQGSRGLNGKKGVSHLHKVGVLGIPDGDHGVHLLDQLLLLIVIELHVPLGQACLARPVLDEDEADLKQAGEEVRQGHGSGWVPPDTLQQRRQGPRLSL